MTYRRIGIVDKRVVAAFAVTLLSAGIACDDSARDEEAGRQPTRAASSPARAGGNDEQTPPPVEPARRLHRYPKSCPGPAPDYEQSAPARWIGKTVGEEPLFAGFYGFSPQHEAVRENAPRRRWGFRIKTLWVMPRESTHVVTVTAQNAETGEPAWFEVDEEPAPQARFDPKLPTHLPEPEARGWKSWGSYIYFPRAGCYRFVARWDSGSWSFVVGFGARP